MKRLLGEFAFYVFWAAGALAWIDIFTKGEVGLVKAIGSLSGILSVLVWIPVGASMALWLSVFPRLAEDLFDWASGNRGKKNHG